MVEHITPLLDLTKSGAAQGWQTEHSPDAAISVMATAEGLRISGQVRPQGAQPGYALAFSPPVEWALGDEIGLRLRVRGDNRRAALLLTCQRCYGWRFRLPFEAPSGQWATISLPFGGFKPLLRLNRRLLRLLPRLKPDGITGWGVYFAAEKEPRYFSLFISAVEAYRMPIITGPIPPDYHPDVNPGDPDQPD